MHYVTKICLHDSFFLLAADYSVAKAHDNDEYSNWRSNPSADHDWFMVDMGALGNVVARVLHSYGRYGSRVCNTDYN
jgi:hypothetical protein